MFGKIAFGRRRALGAHRREPARVMRDHARFARRKGPFVGLPDDFGDGSIARDAQEHPASLAPPFDDPCFDKDADMARDTRLALVEDDRQLADRQFHLAQQRDDSQPRRVRQGTENVDQFAHRPTYKAFFISGQPSVAPRFPRCAGGRAADCDERGDPSQKGRCTPPGETVILRAIGNFRDRSGPVPVGQFN